jgi:hypothetical protein
MTVAQKNKVFKATTVVLDTEEESQLSVSIYLISNLFNIEFMAHFKTGVGYSIVLMCPQSVARTSLHQVA